MDTDQQKPLNVLVRDIDAYASELTPLNRDFDLLKSELDQQIN